MLNYDDQADPLLEVDDLTVSFGTGDDARRVVHGVSFRIARGATLGIVGESGSGKSASCMAIASLLPRQAHASGSVRFRGKDLLGASAATLRSIRGRQIGFIFQDPMSSLNPVLTIERQVTESLRVHTNVNRRHARTQALELLDLVGISDPHRRLRQYPHELSGGMRQRVMIAAALVTRPDLLIADEPTTALDTTVQAQILDLLNRLQEELGMALIIVSHDLGVVGGLADEIAVMYAGRFVERRPAQSVFADPQHPYTVGLLKSIPSLHGDRTQPLESIPGTPPSAAADDDCCSFSPRCGLAKEVCLSRRPGLAEAFGTTGSVACFAATRDSQYIQNNTTVR